MCKVCKNIAARLFSRAAWISEPDVLFFAYLLVTSQLLLSGLVQPRRGNGSFRCAIKCWSGTHRRFQPGNVSPSSPNPVLTALCFRIPTSFHIEALHQWLCFPLPTPSHPSPYNLFRDFSLFARPTFLHRGDPPGWQDGHCDPSRFKAALV